MRAYRKDFARFTKLFCAEYTPFQQALVEEISAGPARVGVVIPRDETDLPVQHALAVWRTMCWTKSITVVVVPGDRYGDSWMKALEQTLGKADASLRTRITMDHQYRFAAYRHGQVANICCMTPQEIIVDNLRGCAGAPLTLIVPNVDAVAGCRIKPMFDAASAIGDLSYTAVRTAAPVVC